MAPAHQTLLDSPNTTAKSSCNCKAIFFVLAIASLALSATYLVPALLISRYNGLRVLSHICHPAQDPKACLTLVSESVPHGVTQSQGIEVLRRFLISYAHHLDTAEARIKEIRYRINEKNEQRAMSDCLELLDLSIDRVHDSVVALANRTSASYANAQAWLSAVLTNHVTCSDGLNISGRRLLGSIYEDLVSRAEASLAMLAAVRSPSDDEVIKPLKAKFPSWVTSRDRKLLESSAYDIKADIVVAPDGTGNYRTVAEAVAAAPDKSKERFVIYVKRGTYKENVEVTKKKKNLMIIGDGMDLTIITGSLMWLTDQQHSNLQLLSKSPSKSRQDAKLPLEYSNHMTICFTAAAVADGFILQDICVQNTAGPEKHQAVALRVGADQSVINRCRIDAFQDTLYTHSLRQFYKDCRVTGTVDFIFGNAAVVLQNCKLVARKPMKNQKNMVTAQGRTDPNQNTGTSIQYCEIIASQDLEPVKSSFPTFLGRPWKEYSRTVVMESYMGDHIDPAGWAPWSGDFALNTLYYGEYMNRGPGAGTSKRVNWSGFHVITEPAEAMKFTVAELIQGGEWLRSTGVEFIERL